jgi:hypothetical protein
MQFMGSMVQCITGIQNHCTGLSYFSFINGQWGSKAHAVGGKKKPVRKNAPCNTEINDFFVGLTSVKFNGHQQTGGSK